MSEDQLSAQASQIFRRAAAYIRNYGWQVTGMSEHGKPRCSMGALASAYDEEKWHKRLSELMYETLYEELGGLSLTQFNYKFRDGEKVAKLFDSVANKLQPAKVSIKT